MCEGFHVVTGVPVGVTWLSGWCGQERSGGPALSDTACVDFVLHELPEVCVVTSLFR